MNEEHLHVIAAMAVDYWKLLRTLERLADGSSNERNTRVSAQARFSAVRLRYHLSTLGLDLATFDGVSMTTNPPVFAINADEVAGLGEVFIESTIEPAVLKGTDVISAGRVIAAVRSE